MKLGFLTAPFPETPLMEVADWAAATGFEVLEIACWPRSSGDTRRYAGTSHIDVANLSDAQASEIRGAIEAKGLAISGLYDLIIRMCFIFGFVFEIPVATVLLIMSGVVDPDKLKEHRGYVVIACFTIGMLVTPPDVFSQSLVAIPMWMLFESGLFFGRIVKRKQAAARAAGN